MKLLKFLLIMVALCMMAASGPVWANRGHSGGHSGGHFHHRHAHWGVVVGAPFFYPWWYHQSVPYYLPPPQMYIEQGSSGGYWYYCNNPPGYYPAVSECPAGWVKVTPLPAP